MATLLAYILTSPTTMAVLSTQSITAPICNAELSLNQSLMALLMWWLVRQLQLAISTIAAAVCHQQKSSPQKQQ